MRYPEQNCPECGHRLFAHVEGGVFCPECGYYFDSDNEDGDREEEHADKSSEKSEDVEQSASPES